MKAGAVGSRFGKLLDRLWGLGSQDVPIDIVPELLPVADVTSGRYEYLAPRGERRFVKNLSRAAAVADFTFVGIRNPAGSRRVIVIEKLHRAGADQEVFVSLRRPGEGTFSANPSLFALDGRLARLGDPFSIDYDAAASGSVDLILFMLQGRSYRIGAVLPPNTSFHVSGNAVNVASGRIGFIGYTRACTPEEMSV